MDTRTGEVKALDAFRDAIPDDSGRPSRQHRQRHSSTYDIRTHIVPIDPANLSARNRAQLEATGQTFVSRNSPCPCGSRKRFKRCCFDGLYVQQEVWTTKL